jgi:hypothetical protein
LVKADLGDVHCMLIFLPDDACSNDVAISARR